MSSPQQPTLSLVPLIGRQVRFEELQGLQPTVSLSEPHRVRWKLDCLSPPLRPRPAHYPRALTFLRTVAKSARSGTEEPTRGLAGEQVTDAVM